MTIPPTIPPAFHSLYLTVAQHGRACALAGGFQEQNPYNLTEPLFFAWRDGWFDGIDSLDLRTLNDFSDHVASNIQQILGREWMKTLAATRAAEARMRN